MNSTLNLNIRLENDSEIEQFALEIKDAIVERTAQKEPFSAIRLRTVRLAHNEYMRSLGRAHEDGLVEFRHGPSILEFADTIIHEMAHQLVGTSHEVGHNEHWRAACTFLGLPNPATKDNAIKEENFDPLMLEEIKRAAEKFIQSNPHMIYDPNSELVFPPIVGYPSCPYASQENCPDGHEIHLMQFQVDGIREMLRRPGNILLGDEMGLGKTIQVIGVINVIHPKSVFIACPNNAKLIWLRHIQKYCVHPEIIQKVQVAYTQLYMFGDFVIMNYEALVRWDTAVRMRKWDMFISDEAHYLKSPSAKRSKAAYKIAADKKVFVTGTPIVNYPFEIFPLLHSLDRKNWPEYGRFEALYGSKTTNKLGRNLNHLNAILRETIMTRRFKKDVMAQLPKKRRQIIEIVPTPEIKTLIDSELELWNKVENESEVVRMLNSLRNESDTAETEVDWHAIVEALTSTKKFLFSEMARIAHEIGRCKVPFAIEHIENLLENREKVIVFGHHRDVLTDIYKHFRGDNGNGSVLLLGGHPNQAQVTQEACDRFNEDEECTVFVAQVSNAQGYSIKSSSTEVFVEEDWVPGVMTQAEDRAHGLGRGDATAKSMLIHHLVFQDSLDTKKAQLTIKKQKSIDRATGKA